VAVAAQAFKRLGDDRDRAFGDPVFADGGGHSTEVALYFIRFIETAC
jgi:hypothetical protein